MSDDDMTIETAEIPFHPEEMRREEHGLFRQELKEVLSPSPETIHQTGLELVNTRLWIDQLNKKYNTPITIDTVPDNEWQRLFARYDSVWFMGIYKPSEVSHKHSEKWEDQYKYALPDIKHQDVVGSPFSIPEYSPNPIIAKDWDAWDKMVEKLHQNKKKVIVDFVPNHMAVDHPWAASHPEYFIQGSEQDFNSNSSLYIETTAQDGSKHYLAHGKDPNYDEWADTLQLNYANPTVQDEMEKVLLSLVDHADGVRCDMAMLVNPDTFIRTWGHKLSDEEKNYISQNRFWEKVVPKVKEKAREKGNDNFLFIGEAYWEKDKLGENFDYLYGKEFYDHLKRIIVEHETPGQALRDHVKYLMTATKSGRHFRDVLFAENHDEERAVREFGKKQSEAVAALTGFIPESIFLLNQGQEEGWTIRPPMQIGRFPNEPVDTELKRFYDRLLALKHSKLFQEGNWNLADIQTLDENMIALSVVLPYKQKEIAATICINLGEKTASARIPAIGTEQVVDVYRLNDGNFVLNPDHEREGGFYIELPPWETQIVFSGSNFKQNFQTQ